MDELAEETTPEKLSQGTIGARRLLQGISLIGFLVSIVPLSADTVSVFGIGLTISEGVVKGILALVLIYLTIGFIVRVLTDIAGARPLRLEIKLRKQIDSQTDDIRQGTVRRLASLMPSWPQKMFHSQSFESLLNDAVPRRSEFRTAMINNTLGEILQWKSVESQQDDSEKPLSKETVAQEFESVLNELLAAHEQRGRRRRWKNAPRWAFYRALILLRFTFFDALAPSLISLLVIALLVGWIDSAWFLDSIVKMAG